MKPRHYIVLVLIALAGCLFFFDTVEIPFGRHRGRIEPCNCKNYQPFVYLDFNAAFRSCAITVTEYDTSGQVRRVLKNPFVFGKDVYGKTVDDVHFEDTMYTAFSYRIQVAKNTDTLLDQLLDSIVIGEHMHYHGCDCLIDSYRLNGVREDGQRVKLVKKPQPL